MLEIIKNKNEFGYYFIILTEEGAFQISFQGNLDLYWRNRYQGNINEQPNIKKFIINKENYYLYQLFEQLYFDIKNLSNNEKNMLHPLFYNNIIEWHSDDAPYSSSSVVKISKERDMFIIIFEKSKTIAPSDLLTYAVSFANSGSRYNINVYPFMKMYNKLIKYEPDIHQMHIEEYIWQKTKKKVN